MDIALCNRNGVANCRSTHRAALGGGLRLALGARGRNAPYPFGQVPVEAVEQLLNQGMSSARTTPGAQLRWTGLSSPGADLGSGVTADPPLGQGDRRNANDDTSL
jgi:hypothetical protein